MAYNKEKITISESLIGSEECETIYLKEDEINEFLEKYLKQNPGSDVEHRFIKPDVKPEEYVQDVQVRWLRPVTPPEASPIIIREGSPVQAPEEPPLRIVELPKKQPASPPPLIIREAPPSLKPTTADPKVIYVPSQKVSHNERFEMKSEQNKSSESKATTSESHSSQSGVLNWSNFEESIRKFEELQKLQEKETLTKKIYSENSHTTSLKSEYEQQKQNLFEEEERRLKAIRLLQIDEERQHKIRLEKIEELRRQELARQKKFEDITRQELARHEKQLEESLKKVHIEEQVTVKKQPEIINMSIHQQLYEEKLRKQEELKRKQDFLQQQQQKYSEAASYYQSLSQSEVNKNQQYMGYENLKDQLKRQDTYEQSEIKRKLEEEQLKFRKAEHSKQQQQHQAHVIPVTLIEKTKSTSNSNIAAPIISTSSHEIAKSSYDYYDYYASSKSSKDNVIESSTKYPSNSNLVIGSVKVEEKKGFKPYQTTANSNSNLNLAYKSSASTTSNSSYYKYN